LTVKCRCIASKRDGTQEDGELHVGCDECMKASSELRFVLGF
jgi:hypothetical protein